MNCDIGFLGFGEAAQAFISDARWQPRAFAYDKKTETPTKRGGKLQDFSNHSVTGSQSVAELCKQASVLLSVVTADQASSAATSVGPYLQADTLYLDMNSVSPSTKRTNAKRIESRGGRFVDVAIMSPVFPAQLDVPILVSGDAAQSAQAKLQECGFTNVRSVGHEIGRASSIKMIRSVMIKGIEALTAECLLAAHAAGVTEDVLQSLGEAWPDRANYNLDRMLVHGKRRSAEMEEVCLTLQELGISPKMSSGAAKWQSQIARTDTPPKRLFQKLDLIHPHSEADVT